MGGNRYLPGSLIANMDSIPLELSIAVRKGWEVHQMDVKNSFLHSDLSEEIYMEQPQGFMQDSSLVCRLKKYLYGLKQAPRAWLLLMHEYHHDSGETRFSTLFHY